MQGTMNQIYLLKNPLKLIIYLLDLWMSELRLTELLRTELNINLSLVTKGSVYLCTSHDTSEHSFLPPLGGQIVKVTHNPQRLCVLRG